MEVITRKNVNKRNLWRYLIYGWLPIPDSIIPPKRPYYLWDELTVHPYNQVKDYTGRLLDEIREATRRCLEGWDPLDRLGIWLSGGIDSSVLLYMTSNLVGPEKVRAYSLSFGERDETELAKKIADWCDVRLIIDEMGPEDNMELTEEVVQHSRAPIETAAVLHISKLCKRDGTKKVFSALGLDELMAGYPAHVNTTDSKFFNLETELIWKCQSQYVWLQLAQSQHYVGVRFPFLDRELMGFCRGLPRSQKCQGRVTKLRIRDELHHRSLIPEENIEAGRIVGTKGGFIPILKDWYNRGYREWCDENILPRSFNIGERTLMRIYLGKGRTLEGKIQRKMRLSTMNAFNRLLDDGKFNL